MHRDIRAVNILITLHETAKISNFKCSGRTSYGYCERERLEQFRYCAPELLLERVLFLPYHKYDYKCEVYSFGILLWEIAEERLPYKDKYENSDISELVCNEMYREPFSENSPMPEKFKQLEVDGVYNR